MTLITRIQEGEGAELRKIISQAIIDTAARPASMRGGYIFNEVELQARAATLKAKETSNGHS